MDALTSPPLPLRPSVWAAGPHAQTLMARTLRSGRGPDYARERIETPDRDFVDIDWVAASDERAPVVVVLHGLEGSARRRYVRNVSRGLSAAGARVAALNFRGCSGEPNRTARFYHSGETGDAAHVLSLIRERYPHSPLGALGFSLGGNVLLKLMGEREDGGRGLLDAAVAMSVPYDLAAGSRKLEQSLSGAFYTAYFLRSLKRKLRLKERLLRPEVDLGAAARSRTLREFDECVTAPLHGFPSADAYYTDSSSSAYLAGVRVPTLLLHALDDPFLPESSIPHPECAGNPSLTLSLQSRGGHVGFLEGPPWRPRFWGDETAVAFLRTSLPGGTGAPRVSDGADESKVP